MPNVQHHKTVNHSLHFADPTTGVHTQNVESYWARVKLKFKRMKGMDAQPLPSYIDEFMWRERYGTTAQNGFDNIIDHIADVYPVWHDSNPASSSKLITTINTNLIIPSTYLYPCNVLSSTCNLFIVLFALRSLANSMSLPLFSLRCVIDLCNYHAAWKTCIIIVMSYVVSRVYGVIYCVTALVWIMHLILSYKLSALHAGLETWVWPKNS